MANLLTFNRFEALPNISIRPSREVRVGRQRAVELWSRPLLLLLGVGLLTLEWALRRRSGH